MGESCFTFCPGTFVSSGCAISEKQRTREAKTFHAIPSASLIFARDDVRLTFVSAIKTIDPNITMAELLREYPGAQRALFRAYHIGGCSSCGFGPDETLAGVCERNDNLPVEEVIETIVAAHDADLKMQISPIELSERRKIGEQLPLIDVRSREEWEAVHIDGAIFLTQDLMQEMISEWPKDREFVFVCHQGIRSLDAASFFAGHGFQNVKSLAGGIDAWSAEVDPALPRYRLE
jgi:rhodanese-related sulfurtransferase